ncbi:S-layer homology domain-containing protein [Vermiculatibacterium agrestimuris]|uniref:S-layer homology domain-containing protein n=1 Tax=Vermiculatibacterium agrestimuris TaxID=2941519 RepID=UPI00203C2A61|nr:S-layer homology domain-containing protein [Vermiculatibacterium agrestimuris]
MNNLKRVLSLGLVGTMLSGMMVMGASAADFTDVDKIQHDEAVNVLVALKVVDGKPDGSFDPEGDVTRSQMAKMIAVAMNGGSEANTGTKTTPTYTDIKGHWAESYIEYCADLGIISGRGDGTFDPDANVTGLEATKMVLTAMGFDAEAYKLTGAQWAVRTDEVARTMTGTQEGEPNMYEDLAGVMMAANASRDTAAQLIWNGLQNRTRTVQPTTTSGGGVEWTYVTNSTSLLKQRYDAEVKEGQFKGNEKTGATTTEGEIVVDNWSFPSDFDISNIGETVKVVYKEGKGGVTGPDKKDTILGVFNANKSQVVKATLNDVADAKDDLKKGKIKVAGTLYEIDDKVTVHTNYGESSKDYTTAKAIQDDLKKVNGDAIKVVINDDNKVTDIYLVQSYLAKVTSVTSSKITLSGIGTIDLEDNDVAEGLKKNDVVVVTSIYAEKTKTDDAHYTVAKAEVVEGEITSFEGTKSVAIDSENYKIREENLGNYKNVVDDAYTGFDGNIGNTVAAYLVNGFVAVVNELESGASDWALVIASNGKNWDATKMDQGRVQLLKPDGSKPTYNVDEKSDIQLAKDSVAISNLIKYSVTNDGTIKIKTAQSTTAANGQSDKDASFVKVTGGDLVWDDDTKMLGDVAVAASDAVLFVNTSADATADYKYYSLRNLGDIKATDAAGKDEAKDVAYVKDSSGRILYAYVDLGRVPGGATADTLYGMITTDLRTVKVGDEQYKQATVWTQDGEKTIKVDADYVGSDASKLDLKKGAYISFKETSDELYDKTTGEMKVLAANVTAAAVNSVLDVAVDSYSESDKTLSYYVKGQLEKTLASGVFEAKDGENAKVNALDKDAVIVYVDRDNKKGLDDVGISAFPETKGYANAKLVFDTEKTNKIVAIIFNANNDTDVNGNEVALGNEEKAPAVAVTSADLSKDAVEITAADTAADAITVSNIKPDNATDKTVTVESADDTKVIASVSGTTITVKTAAGLTNSANGTVKVTVKVGGVQVGEITVTINIA